MLYHINVFINKHLYWTFYQLCYLFTYDNSKIKIRLVSEESDTSGMKTSNNWKIYFALIMQLVAEKIRFNIRDSSISIYSEHFSNYFIYLPSLNDNSKITMWLVSKESLIHQVWKPPIAEQKFESLINNSFCQYRKQNFTIEVKLVSVSSTCTLMIYKFEWCIINSIYFVFVICFEVF